MLNWVARQLADRKETLRARRASRPSFEALEDRWAPAITALPPGGAGLNLGRFPNEAQLQQALRLTVPALAINVASPAQNLAIHSNVAVTGTVQSPLTRIGAGSLVNFQVRIDSGAFARVGLTRTGQFTVPTHFKLDGTAEGAHTLTLRAIEPSGRVATRLVRLNVDTVFPTFTNVDLATAFDTGTLGDKITSQAKVTITGKTEAGATVTLNGNAATKVTADSTGAFSFTNVDLTAGANAFVLHAVDKAGNATDTDTSKPHPDFTLTITRDSIAPVIGAHLANDTGALNNDNLTNAPTIIGTVNDTSPITAFTAGLDDTNTANFVNVQSLLVTGGAFTFDLAQLTVINHGTTVTDGTHILRLVATDAAGNQSAILTFTFTLDRATAVPSLDLDSSSDSGTLGDHQTALTNVKLSGVAEGGATVNLVDGSNNPLGTTTAAGDGTYSFPGITLAPGSNSFTVTVTDLAGNTNTFTRTIVSTDNAPTVSATIADVNVATNAASTLINLAAHFRDADIGTSLVRFDTSAGAINVQLFDSLAPQTVANFLDYVQNDAYDESIFHRLLAGFVIQGGGFKIDGTGTTVSALSQLPPVNNEFGTSNTTGTIAMAKVPGDPNSATNQFFFNLANNTGLNTDNGGFTVFGKVVGTDQNVVNTLAATPTQNFSNVNSNFANFPITNYSGSAATFPGDANASNYLVIHDIAIVQRLEFLSYTIQNDNPTLVTAALMPGTSERLQLQYAAGQTGTAHITVTAHDQFGATVNAQFTVTVGP